MIVFVDTVALLALWDIRDQWHDIAEAAFIRAFEQNWTLVTSSTVLLECGNAAARRSFRDAVLDLRHEFMSRNHLIDPEPADVVAAWTGFAQHAAADAGIVDLLSFAIMRRLGITSALTNDEHFRAAGFETLM